ncbi:hypothetical protein F954_02204, partial [Acinetobacter brisouii ANC 4119]
FAIRYSLFAIRYSLFAIRYSLAATTMLSRLYVIINSINVFWCKKAIIVSLELQLNSDI